MSRTFVIGDIHGCAQTFTKLVFETVRLRQTDRLYLLGDIIDRGPASKEVIDTILRMRSAGYSVEAVRGNHEEMLLNACLDRDYFLLWLENGGMATLRSFGVEDACEIPHQYRQFLAGFPYYILLDGFVLAHAGMNCSAPDPFADTETMLWSRNQSVIPALLGGRRIICGHTPHPLSEITASLRSDRIVLDGGCVYPSPHLGLLVCLEIETMTLHHAENIDK